ncbi:hypothetical protein RAA17_18900 [Komagataeibacter rhaeticus]|nr:hypothetical protein [Komagataeibacter rhaeticus]
MDTDPDICLRATSLHRRLLLWRGGAVAFCPCLHRGLRACVRGGWTGHQAPHLVHLKVQGVIGADEHENVEALNRARDDAAVRGCCWK